MKSKMDRHEFEKALDSLRSVDLISARNSLLEVVEQLFRSGSPAEESFWHRAKSIEVVLTTMDSSLKMLENDMKAAFEEIGGGE